ncbi:MAG: two-component regulator propeller domain-containing protein [bacterium]
MTISKLNKNMINMFFKPLFFLMLIGSNVFSQTDDKFIFDRIHSETGLPSTSITAIIQDSNGLMWIGTENGLCFYDGYSFKVFQNDPADSTSISDNWVLSLLEDKNGNIWVGTHSGGINKFDKNKGYFFNFKVKNEDLKSLKNNRVWTIFEDDDGAIWFGTSGGINKFNNKTNVYTNYCHNSLDANSLSNDAVNIIFKDSKANIWLGTFGGGLNKLVKTGSGYKFENFSSYPLLQQVANAKIKAITEDKTGVLWLGTFTDGLIRFDYLNKTSFNYKKGNNSFENVRINSLLRDKEGNLWIGGHKFGLSYLSSKQIENNDYRTYTFVNYTNDNNNVNSINDNSILSIYQDNTGLIWYGSNRGLNKLNNTRVKFLWYKNNPSIPYSLSDDIVKSVYQDTKGNIWVGTYYGGLNKFDPLTGKFVRYLNDPKNINSISDNTVWAIKEDKNGNIWCGTSYGLNKFDPVTGKFKVYLKNTLEQQGLIHNNISCLYFDNDNYLWIGTWGGGLSILDLNTEKFYAYYYDKTDSNTLSNDQIKFVFEDTKNNVWIGTLGGGINRINRKDLFLSDNNKLKFSHYSNTTTKKHSLSNNSLTCVYEDKNENIYFGTYGGGLNKLNLNSIKSYNKLEFEVLLNKQGLAGNTIYGILEDNGGVLWISTNNGLSRYDKELGIFTNFTKVDGLQGNDFEQGYFKLQDGRLIFGGLNGFNLFDPAEIIINRNKPNIMLTSFKVFNVEKFSLKDIFNKKEIILNDNEFVFSFEFAALDYSDPSKNIYKYKLEGFDSEWNFIGSRRYGSYTNLDGGEYILKIKATNSSGVWNEEGISIKIIIKTPFYRSIWATILYLIIVGFILYFIFVMMLNKHKAKIIGQKKTSENTKNENESFSKTEKLKEALYKISEVVNNGDKLEEFYKQIYNVIYGLIPAKSFYLALLDEQKGIITFPFYINENKGNAEFKPDQTMEEKTLFKYILQKGEIVIIKKEEIEELIKTGNIQSSNEKFNEWLGAPLKTSNGKIIGVLAVFSSDTSISYSENDKSILSFVSSLIAMTIERKKAEDMRRKYDFIVNTSGSYMTLINTSYIYEAANDSFCKSHKATRNEIVGKSISDLWGSYAFETKIKNYFNLSLAGEEINYQAWLETKNTGLKCYDITYYPYYDENNKITHVVVVSRDITLLVKAEETVRKLLLAVEQTEEVIFMTDFSGTITYINPSFQKIYGYTKEDVIGKSPGILKSGVMQEEEYTKMWTLLISGKPYKAEFVNRTKTGEFIEIENSVSPFYDNFNNVLGFISVQTDISERKKSEKALLEAKELAEKSDKLKTEFLSQLSHEIRTPLNAIINSSDLIKEDMKNIISNDTEILFDSVTSSAKRIIRTVHMILNMSELQTKTYEYVPKYIDFPELLKKVLEEYLELAVQKNVKIIFNNNLQSANIFADEYSVNQILTQLIDNAVKFTDDGIVEITIDKNKFNELRFSIKDTGIGISSEYKNNLYQPFSQEAQGYTRKYDGNGLGLALTKKYCELNNADILCNSNKGLGTEFSVVFNNTKVY